MNLKSAFDLFKALSKTLLKLRSSLSLTPLFRIYLYRINLSKFLFLLLGVSLFAKFFFEGISKTSDTRETWAGTVTYSRSIHGNETRPDKWFTYRIEQHLEESATVDVTLRYTHSIDSEDYFEGESLSGNYSVSAKERTDVTDNSDGQQVTHNKKAQCSGALGPLTDGGDGGAEILLVVDRITKTYTLNVDIYSPVCDGSYVISPGGAQLEYWHTLEAPFPYYEGAVQGNSIAGSWQGPPAKLGITFPPGGKMPGASFKWNFTKAGGYKVKITKPKEDEQFVFSDNEEVAVWTKAEADPESRNDSIRPWSIDPIKGSELKIDPDPPVGQIVLFKYSGLPDDSNQFGQKTIRADNARPVTVKVFFPKAYKSRGKPNWFRYWKQGAVPDMDPFKYRPNIDSFGYFKPPNTLVLGDRASLKDKGLTITIRKPKLKVIHIPELKGVDLCHAVVLHELMHKSIYDKYHGLEDSDGDGLPDVYEILSYLDYGFDRTDPDTHDLKRISSCYASYGDEELLCREAEKGNAAKHELDWAFPGKQSDPEY